VTDGAARSGILVGYDGSRLAARAIDWAVAEARWRGTSLVVCTVIPDVTPARHPGNAGWTPGRDMPPRGLPCSGCSARLATG